MNSRRTCNRFTVKFLTGDAEAALRELVRSLKPSRRYRITTDHGFNALLGQLQRIDLIEY